MEVPINEPKPTGGPSGSRTLNFATIVSNSVPVAQMDDYLVCHLWLMFASGCYFKDLSTNWLTPGYDLNASTLVDPKLKREAKWELINGPGSLPLSVDYLETSRLGNTPERTNASYLATGLTNAGAVKLPSGFVFEQKFSTRKRAVATVTDVRPVCSRSDLLPATSGKTVVDDRRLAAEAVRTGGTVFAEGEIQSLSLMISRLRQHADKVSLFLWQGLSNPEQAMLTNPLAFQAGAREARNMVVRALNKAVEGPCIYEGERFQGIPLRPETTNLLRQAPTGAKLAHLNRLLLEDAFPVVLSPPTHTPTYVVQDGVQWVPVEKAKQMYNQPPVAPPKRSSTVTVVFYGSMVLLSAVFLYFLSRLKQKRM